MGLFHKHYAPPDTFGLHVDTLLAKAKAAKDPRDAYAYLTRAEELSPDDLSVQRELLLQGDLHKRDPKHISFFVIKCYLLHAFEHPEMHEEAEQQRMCRELFDHPRLQRCLALCPDRTAFLRDYLQALCTDYMRIFIAPDASHRPAILGVVLPGQMSKSLSAPAYDVLYHIFSSPFLSEEEQSLLGGAFYRAYSAYVGGETQPLDARLGDTLSRLIR